MIKTLFIVALLLSVSMGAHLRNKSHSKSKAHAKTETARKSPSDLLIDHLEGVEGRLRGEQLKENEIYDSQMVECNAEKEARAQAIQDAEDSLKRAQNHYVRCDSALHQTKADLAQIKKFITEIKFNQQALKVNREREAREFNDLISKEIDPALSAIQQAYPIIDELTQSEVSFVQVTDKLTGMFLQFAESDKAALMAPLLSAFVQLQGDFTESDVEAIRRLFEQLEQDLTNVKNDAMRIEDERKTVYNDTMGEYNTIVDGLSEKQRSLESYENQMHECIVIEQGVIDAASAKLRNNKQALAYAITMCDAFEVQYQHAKAARSRELELLAKLKAFVREKSEVFGNYGTERSNVFEDYKASYEKKQFVQVDQFLESRRLKMQSNPSFVQTKEEDLAAF